MYGRDIPYTARFIVELFTIAVPNGSEKEPARMSDVGRQSRWRIT